MPFDYMHGSTNIEHHAEAWRDQHIRAIRERAKLLFNLRFSLAEATDRIQAAYTWEFDDAFESTKLPDFYAEIPALVGAVYKHLTRD